jgi:Ras-related protein Rab-18
MLNSYYRGAHGVILMYDSTNRSSFDNLKYWLGEVKQNCTNPNVVLMLVASKLDSSNDIIQVMRTEGEVFSIEHSMMFYEISSKDDVGISECFNELVLSLIETSNLSREPTGTGINTIDNIVRSTRRCNSC